MTQRLLDKPFSGLAFDREGDLFTFRCSMMIHRHAHEVFEFFSDARNLQELTPKWLNFVILTPGRLELRKGAMIDYRLRLRGIPFRWQTEITRWEPPESFVDEQRRGPYRVWIHEHRFIRHDQQTEVLDLVKYLPPCGWLADRLFVRRDVAAIFRYRQEKLRKIFSGEPAEKR